MDSGFHRSVNSLIRKIIFGTAADVSAGYAGAKWRRFCRLCHSLRRYQDELLSRIVCSGADTDFGRAHGLHHVRSYQDFAKALPIAQYDYFAPYVQRCLSGHYQALISPNQRLVMFALTSGTTGPAKFIPVTRQLIDYYRRGWNIWGGELLMDHRAGLVRSILQISSPARQQIAPCGLPGGSISGLLAAKQHSVARALYAVPYWIADIPDPQARYYTIMRLAIPKDVGLIVTANPSTLVMLARLVEKNVQAIIRDIYDGTLDCVERVPTGMLDRFSRILRLERSAARRLEQILIRSGHLWPRDYWGRPVLCHWKGGTVGLYVPQVLRYYGDVVIRDIGLIASEGRMSIPIEDFTASGVLDISSAFFEFVPQQQIDRLDLGPDADVLPAGLTVLRPYQLEVGQSYYILITNSAGLYRYHIGDVVRLAGWLGNTPMIEFLSKGQHTSNLTGEKLSEHQVVEAVRLSLRSLGMESDCFVLTPVWAQNPFYRLLIEVESTYGANILQRLALELDNQLCSANCEYASKRRTGQARNGRQAVCTGP